MSISLNVPIIFDIEYSQNPERTLTCLYSLSRSHLPLILKLNKPSLVTENAFFPRTVYLSFSCLSYFNPTPRLANNYKKLSDKRHKTLKGEAIFMYEFVPNY